MLNLDTKLTKETIGGNINVIEGQPICGSNLPIKVRMVGKVRTFYTKVSNGILVETITMNGVYPDFSPQVLNTTLDWDNI